jgi:LAO/AO transport system kinase
VVINKADLDADAATRAQAQITSVMRMFGQHGDPHHALHNRDAWHPQVIQLSALLGDGVDRFCSEVEQFRAVQEANGRLKVRRQHQSLSWMWERIDPGLRQSFHSSPSVSRALPKVIKSVLDGKSSPSASARELLGLFQRTTGAG